MASSSWAPILQSVIHSTGFDSFKLYPHDFSQCEIFFRAKQTRKMFPKSFNKAETPFYLLHCDVWGPYRILFSSGANYFLTIVEDFSRTVWKYLMLKKSEVSKLLQNFCAMAEKQFGYSVMMVRSDNGSEFMVLKTFIPDKWDLTSDVMHRYTTTKRTCGKETSTYSQYCSCLFISRSSTY